jgi:hypothetical protein
MQINWKGALAGLILVIVGAITGQLQLVATGTTIAGSSIIVTPAPATVTVEARVNPQEVQQ